MNYFLSTNAISTVSDAKQLAIRTHFSRTVGSRTHSNRQREAARALSDMRTERKGRGQMKKNLFEGQFTPRHASASCVRLRAHAYYYYNYGTVPKSHVEYAP